MCNVRSRRAPCFGSCCNTVVTSHMDIYTLQWPWQHGAQTTNNSKCALMCQCVCQQKDVYIEEGPLTAYRSPKGNIQSALICQQARPSFIVLYVTERPYWWLSKSRQWHTQMLMTSNLPIQHIQWFDDHNFFVRAPHRDFHTNNIPTVCSHLSPALHWEWRMSQGLQAWRLDKPLYMSREWGSKLYLHNAHPHIPDGKRWVVWVPRNCKWNSLSNGRANYQVRRCSHYKWLPFSNEQYSDLPAPGNMREVMLQVRVGAKVGVKIGRNQESVASNSYKGVEDLWLGSTW